MQGWSGKRGRCWSKGREVSGQTKDPMLVFAWGTFQGGAREKLPLFGDRGHRETKEAQRSCAHGEGESDEKISLDRNVRHLEKSVGRVNPDGNLTDGFLCGILQDTKV